MSLWIPVTLAAASFQTVRFMLQKSLSSVRLTASGATFARFAYSAPLAVAALCAVLLLGDRDLPQMNMLFGVFVVVGGIAQILATICVVALFKQRNFAVGITFAKTEVIQTALVGFVVLGDTISGGALFAIGLGLWAVLLLSKAPGGSGAWWRHLTNRASQLGLGSGLLFAFSAVSYRGASLQLADGDAWFRALVTLACVTAFQLLSMWGWLMWRDRGELPGRLGNAPHRHLCRPDQPKRIVLLVPGLHVAERSLCQGGRTGRDCTQPVGLDPGLPRDDNPARNRRDHDVGAVDTGACPDDLNRADRLSPARSHEGR